MNALETFTQKDIVDLYECIRKEEEATEAKVIINRFEDVMRCRVQKGQVGIGGWIEYPEMGPPNPWSAVNPCISTINIKYLKDNGFKVYKATIHYSNNNGVPRLSPVIQQFIVWEAKYFKKEILEPYVKKLGDDNVAEYSWVELGVE
jgi:hypothetical protein